MKPWSLPALVGMVIAVLIMAASGNDNDTKATPATASTKTKASAAPGGAPKQTNSSGSLTGSKRDSGVTLTFDDGPHATYTPQILEILAEHDTTAVFCVIGKNVAEHPHLVKRIVDEGHTLCNHTTSHDSHLTSRDASHIEEEITGTREAIDAASGEAPVPYFRQPAMYVTDKVGAIADSLGYQRLDWTLDTRDWTKPGAAAISDTVADQLKPGAIILLHDGGGDRSGTVAALPGILAEIEAADLDVVLPR